MEGIIPGGPAEIAGMLVGDHILQVDGVEIGNEPHKKVVERIRSGDSQGMTFLVVDPQTEKEMKERVSGWNRLTSN